MKKKYGAFIMFLFCASSVLPVGKISRKHMVLLIKLLSKRIKNLNKSPKKPPAQYLRTKSHFGDEFSGEFDDKKEVVSHMRTTRRTHVRPFWFF